MDKDTSGMTTSKASRIVIASQSQVRPCAIYTLAGKCLHLFKGNVAKKICTSLNTAKVIGLLTIYQLLFFDLKLRPNRCPRPLLHKFRQRFIS